MKFAIAILLSAVMVSVVLSGCEREEEVVVEVEVGDISSVIEETARTIARAHLPAHTRLCLADEPTDAFGLGLVAQLRGMGFSVAESDQPAAQRLVYLAEVQSTGNLMVVVRVGAEKYSCLYRSAIGTDGVATYTRLGAWAVGRPNK